MAAVARSLVLIGFMGAGKTSAARALAGALGVEAVDADALLEERAGATVAELFAREGEQGFRAREEELVAGLLEGDAPPAVLALGGGAIGSERVRAALARHVVVHLDVDLEMAWQRARQAGDRPLARDRDHFARLHAERAPLYEEAADAFLPAGGDRRVAERAAPALALLRDEAPPRTRLAWAHSASGDYPVFVGRGVLGLRTAAGRAVCVTDTNVGDLYVGALGRVDGVVEIPPGEEHKTLETAERVWRALAEQGLTRGDHLVALGGGVVGDLAGFCAATYQRGVPVVHVPTTLVAQVDSAYGGKTGVDLPEGKNYVGAYHQPAAVLTDPGTLRTLPDGELAAGWAEVVKTALLAGGRLWERVRAGDLDDDVILACARYKLAVVADDERDAGRRQVLNLGHTLGHAIETATGYTRYRHGEAVALGLLAALRLSGLEDLRAEVAELLRERGLPTTLEGVDADRVVELTARDKKRVGDGPVPFVLLEAPGDPRPGRPVAPDDVFAAVAELCP